jgi:hypothetical protein
MARCDWLRYMVIPVYYYYYYYYYCCWKFQRRRVSPVKKRTDVITGALSVRTVCSGICGVPPWQPKTRHKRRGFKSKQGKQDKIRIAEILQRLPLVRLHSKKVREKTVNIVQQLPGCVNEPLSFQDLVSEHRTFSFQTGKCESRKIRVDMTASVV